ncbi:MAG: Rrf2 family transcriptional regulator [Clostridiales bacterium]|nr:Rrf2 family transcriptional regulator [Clostridiales bacterium]
MRLSTRATYGMRLCFMLALSKSPLSASQLVKQTDVGIKYLEQLLSMLKRGKIVTAYRGKSGGYVLARDPKDITVGDMLGALDDGFDAPACVCGTCEDMYCPNRNVLNKLSDGINKVLDSVTLAEMVEEHRGNCGASGGGV